MLQFEAFSVSELLEKKGKLKNIFYYNKTIMKAEQQEQLFQLNFVNLSCGNKNEWNFHLKDNLN